MTRQSSQPPTPTVSQWFERYRMLRDGEVSEAMEDQEAVTMRYLAEWGPLRLSSITPAMASDWIRKLRDKKLAKATIAKHARMARAIFARAEVEFHGWRSPFAQVRVKTPVTAHRSRYVPLGELRAMMGACPSDGLRRALALARLAGLRKGECLRLRWEDVDMDRRRITVWPERGEVTTKQALRSVPIRPELAQILSDPSGESPCYGVPSDGRLSRALEKVRRGAGVAPYGKPMHALRAHAEQDWLHQGYPPADVAKWLGHDAAVAYRHYHTARDPLMDRAAGLTSGLPDQVEAELAVFRAAFESGDMGGAERAAIGLLTACRKNMTHNHNSTLAIVGA